MPSYTMSFDSQLSEGYVLTAGIPVDTSLATPVATFVNAQGDTELLAIHTNGELYHVRREPLSESGWNFHGIGAGLVAIAAIDANRVIAFGLDNQVWRLAGQRWTKLSNPAPGEATGAADVSTGVDGTIWATDNNQQLYAFASTGSWQPVAGAPPLVRAPHGSSANAWAIGTDIQPVNGVNGTWTSVPLPAGDLASWLAVAPDGTVWVVGANGLYQRNANGNAWQTMPATEAGTAIQQFCAVGPNELWALVCRGSAGACVDTPWIEHFVNGQWQRATDAPSPGFEESPNLPAISAGTDGTVYVLDTFHNVWRFVQGAWQRCLLPTGMGGYTAAGGVTEVVVSEGLNHVWHALYVQNGVVNYTTFASGLWTTPQSVCPGRNVGLTAKTALDEPTGYGVSGGQFLVITLEGGAAVSSTIAANESLDDDVIPNLSISDGYWVTTAVIRSGLLFQAWGSKTNPLSPSKDISPAFIPVNDRNGNKQRSGMKQVIRLPWDSGSAYTLVLDRAGTIWLVGEMGYGITTDGGFSLGTYNALTGNGLAPFGGATKASAVIDSDGFIRIYATDAQQKLWVLRQTGETNNAENPFTWTAWHPLGSELAHLVNGPGDRSTSELYSIGSDETLALLDQRSSSKTWTELQIKRPATADEESEYLTQYLTEMSFVDDAGRVAPNYPVTISVDEPDTIRCGNQTYDIEPGQPLSLTTDGQGKLRVSRIATGLHTPTLTVQGEGLTNPPPIYPPQQVHNYLAGVATLPGKATFTSDGGALMSAQAQSGSAFAAPTSMVESANHPNVPIVASAVLDIFKMNPTPSASGARGAVRLRPAAPGATPTGSESFWQELTGFVEDIYHAIRNGAIKVKDVETDLARKVVTLTLSLEGLADQAIEFVIHSVEEAAHALHNAFLWIVKAIDTALDWLKGLFGWSDIWNTTQVVAHIAESSIQAMRDLLAINATTKLDGLFSGLKSQATDSLTTSTQVVGSKSFAELMPQQKQGQRGVGLPPFNPTLVTKSDSRHNWLLQQILSYLSSSDSLDRALFQDVEKAVQAFMASQDVQQTTSDVNQSAQAITTLFQDLQANPWGFMSHSGADFLRVIGTLSDLALDAAQTMATGVIDMVVALLDCLDTVLTQPMDIPLVSSLFEEMTASAGNKQSLTILNAASLALGFQVTLMHKAITGGDAPFTNDQVTTILNSGFFDVASPKTPAPSASPYSVALLTVYFGVMLEVAILDVASDMLAMDLAQTEWISNQTGKAIMFYGVMSFCTGILAQYFIWRLTPVGQYGINPANLNLGQRFVLGVFYCGFLPPTLTAIWTWFPGALMRAEPVGQAVLTTAGLLSMILGIIGSAMATDVPVDQASGIILAILQNLPNAATPLLIGPVIIASDELTPAVKMAIDVMSDGFNAVITALTTKETPALAQGASLA